METIDFTKFCLLTGSKEHLSTKMDIEHDGKLYKIAISDDAEEGSIKVIKSKLIATLVEVDALIARANDFGLHISYRRHSAPTPTPTPMPEPVSAPVLDVETMEAPIRSTSKDEVRNVALVDMEGNVQEIKIPKIIKDKNGTTEINVVKVTNKELMAQGASYNGVDFRKGYAASAQTRNCGSCRGSGVVKMAGSKGVIKEIDCKKCGGLGIIA